jgi:DNA-binding transcriptional MocR family regulator
VHRYGNILGDNHLKDLIRKNLFTKGFDTEGLDIMVTPGANQAFTNIALAICDKGDSAGNNYRNLKISEQNGQ